MKNLRRGKVKKCLGGRLLETHVALELEHEEVGGDASGRIRAGDVVQEELSWRNKDPV